MEVFKKISVDFDYQKLRKDVEDTYYTIKSQAIGTEYEILSNRNLCLTVSKENSDDWSDGIAGKSLINKSREGNPLTAWELEKAGIPHTLVADNAGGFLMQEGMVDCVLVGADRVGVDGAVCNKIGTYLKALPAKANKVPFYVAAPKSTFDKNFSMTNKSFEIEKRDASELFTMKGINKDGEILTVNLGHFEGYNPAFDITPPEFITGIICEEGIIKPENLKEFLG